MQFEENCLDVNWIKLARGAGDRNILLIGIDTGIDTGLVIGYSLSGELVEGLAAELTS